MYFRMLWMICEVIAVLLCSKRIDCPARQEHPETVRAKGRADRQTMTTLLIFVR
jgi:hypothetical protein